MAFVDMRRPTAWDWLLVFFCPSGIIAYHGHRSAVKRSTVFVFAFFGFCVSLGFIPICFRNLLLGQFSENYELFRCVMEVDGLLIPTAVCFVLGGIMVAKAADVMREAMALQTIVQTEKEEAIESGRKWTPPERLIPPTAKGVPLYQDILLYVLSPAAAAGLYNRRRWGMVAGFLGIHRLSVILSGHLARIYGRLYFESIHPHVLETTGINLLEHREQMAEYLKTLAEIGWYDALFIPSCISYSIFSVYTARKEASLDASNSFVAASEEASPHASPNTTETSHASSPLTTEKEI